MFNGGNKGDTAGMCRKPPDRAPLIADSAMVPVQFLERDPNKRLGYRADGGGFEDIKADPWFQGLDWDAIYRKEAIPPFEPDVRAHLDVGCRCETD
jgi:serine/threonine kinase 32